MSELTLCNYCSLKQIERLAEAAGEKVIVYRNTAYTVPKALSKKAFLDLPDGDPDKKTGKGKYFSAWFMQLPDHCCC